MIDPSLEPQDPARAEHKSRPVAPDSTRMYVRRAQARADRGEPIDEDSPATPTGGGLRGLLRRLWPRRRSG